MPESTEDTPEEKIAQNGLNRCNSENIPTAYEEKKRQTALKLAQLYFIEGISQWKAVQQVFGYAEATCKGSGSRIFEDYDVVRVFLDQLPTKLDEKDFERMLTVVQKRALKTGDSKLLLEVIDRFGKALGKYKDQVSVTVSRDEAYVRRLERAKKILQDQGIDTMEITKTSR